MTASAAPTQAPPARSDMGIDFYDLWINGYRIIVDDECQDGMWLARGGYCQWFPSISSAAEAVRRGNWPWGSGR